MTSRLSTAVKSGNKKAGQIKSYIDRLRESSEALMRQEYGDSVGGHPRPSGEIKIRENMLSSLTTHCVQTAQRLQKAQQDCQIAMKQKRRRHIQVANPELCREDVDAAVDSGVGGDALMKSIAEV
jgi:hypothetical protein